VEIKRAGATNKGRPGFPPHPKVVPALVAVSQPGPAVFSRELDHASSLPVNGSDREAPVEWPTQGTTDREVVLPSGKGQHRRFPATPIRSRARRMFRADRICSASDRQVIARRFGSRVVRLMGGVYGGFRRLSM